MKRFILTLIILIFVSFLGACALTDNNVKDESLDNAKNFVNYKFEDLPIPTTLTLNSDESFLYETSNYRTGILVYEGKDDIKNLENFYKSEMVKYNWELVNSLEYKRIIQLIFEKPGWISVLNMKQKGSNVILTITIGPVVKEKNQE